MNTVKIKLNNKTLELPEYLGFGILDKSSIKKEKGTCTAKYLLDNNLVYLVEIGGDRDYIYSFFNSKRLSTTFHIQLDWAFIKNYEFINSSTDPRFKYLSKTIDALDNMLFETPEIPLKSKDPMVTYYPAGQFFLLRYVYEKESPNLSNFINEVESNKYKHIQVYSKSDGFMFCYLENGDVTIRNVKVINFISPLAYITNGVRIISKKKIIGKDKKLRLIVQDLQRTLMFDTEIFWGDLSSNILIYAILYKITDDYNKDKYIDAFIQKSHEYLGVENHRNSIILN